MYRVKPSKPVAVFGAVFGAAVIIFGAVSVHKNLGFLALWIVAGVAIIGFNLWSAFSANGSTEVITQAGGEPRVAGSTVTKVGS